MGMFRIFHSREFCRHSAKCHHGDNLTRIHEAVIPDILPSELGGKVGPMSNKKVFELALRREKMFQGASMIRQTSTKMGFLLDIWFYHVSFTDLTNYG